MAWPLAALDLIGNYTSILDKRFNKKHVHTRPWDGRNEGHRWHTGSDNTSPMLQSHSLAKHPATHQMAGTNNLATFKALFPQDFFRAFLVALSAAHTVQEGLRGFAGLLSLLFIFLICFLQPLTLL
mmetsp:Transcript_58792/g.137672  ORF Transcript_58792/g.137672 Transcript_58792/m.137672 type:complete len:126 (+) Transcript_58792:77-454(+)